MDLGLKGKNVIVTGGSRGIGRSIALAFADEGANLAICARGMDALASVRDELTARGVTAFAQSCDVGDAAALAAFLDAANAALGGVDVLVNNPSGFGLGDTEEAWSLGFNVDMMAAVRASRQVVPWMEARGGGAIVNIASDLGILGRERYAPYCAAKAGVIGLTKSLAREFAPQHIRVNAIAPGPVATAMVSLEHMSAEWVEKELAIPQHRLGAPEDIAATALFLASDLSGFYTGQVLGPNGGSVMP